MAREIAAVQHSTETETVKVIDTQLAKSPRRGAKTEATGADAEADQADVEADGDDAALTEAAGSTDPNSGD